MNDYFNELRSELTKVTTLMQPYYRKNNFLEDPEFIKLVARKEAIKKEMRQIKLSEKLEEREKSL